MKQLLLVFLAIILLSGVNKAQTVKTIPNGNFENWDSISYTNLDSPWTTSNPDDIVNYGKSTVTQVTGQSGYAVHLQGLVVGQDTFISEIATVIPTTQAPTGLAGYYRCNLVGKDSAWLIVALLQAGNVVGYGVYTFTGSQSSFSPFTCQITPFGTPDSIAILASSSNIGGSSGAVEGGPNDWLELDGLTFTGTGITQTIPDGGFENWTTKTADIPVGWQVNTDLNFDAGASKSTDPYAGKYALKLMGSTILTSGKFDQNGNTTGGAPYTQTVDTLTGYYKYMPSGVDTGGILVTLQNKGVPVFQVKGEAQPVSTWTYFEIPLNASFAPDTMRIDLYSSTGTTSGLEESTLYLDNLQLKSQPLAGIPFSAKPSFGITAFPDPAQNQLNIKFAGNVPSEFGLKVYNTEGRLMIDNQYSSGTSMVTLPVDQLSPGLYYYEITANGATVRNKFVKGN